jgi:tripartite-type tricarboxylate transporter receptor subunit TctC
LAVAKPMKYIAIAVMVSFAASAVLLDYPDKPITLVVPFAAGGPTEVGPGDQGRRTISRLVVAQFLSIR